MTASRLTARILAGSIAALLAAPSAQAVTYYWDTDGSGTPGFGNTAGTWGTSAFWGTDLAGSGATANTTITNLDGVNFGTATLALGATASTIAIDAGGVTTNSITFGSAQVTAVTLSGGGGTITLAGTTPTITVNNTSDTIGAVLAGTDGLTKAGAGTLILSGSNTYTGGTTVSAGTLIAGHASALGGGTVTMAANTALLFGTSGTFANNITMGSGSTLAPTQNVTPITYSGTITLNGTNSGTSGVAIPTTAVAVSAFSGGDTQTFDNPIGGTGDFAFRGGGAAANHNHTYILKGSASTYTGNTWLYTSSVLPNSSNASNVVLQLQGGALPSTTVLTMTQNNGGTSNNSVLDLNGNNQTLAGLTTFTINTGGRGWFISNTHASAASTLTINNTGNFTFAGVIGVNSTTAQTGQAAGAGNIALIKSGAGTQTLTGANTYTGATTISDGILQIGAGGTTGTLGSGTVLNNAALVFNRSNLYQVDNVISGSGSVRINAVTAGNLIDIAANNSYGGGTFIDVGILRLRTDLGGGADLGTGTVTVANGASYEIWAPTAKSFTNNIVLNGATGVAGRPALNQDGGGGLVTLSGTVTLNATSDIGIGGLSSNSMTISGVISGTAGAGLIVQQRTTNNGFNATLTLSGANTFTGPITHNGGTLKAGVASVANVSGAFGKNTAVTLANAANTNLDITGFATQIGSLTGGGATGGNVTLGSAILTVGGDNTSPAAYAGVISGGGGVTKIGIGTQILSGTNSYTGTTTVSAGTLTFAGSSTGTLGAINVGGTGTTQLNIQAGSYTQGAGGFFVGGNAGTGAGIVNHTGGALVLTCKD